MPHATHPPAEVALLIAHYNDTVQLSRALQSIQESVPVDVLVVDDGSQQKPNELECQQLYQGGKLQVLYLERNGGQAKARNKGLALLKDQYPYIAILDSDDINRPGRISQQLTFLKKHPNTYLVGSWCEYITPEGKPLYIQRFPTEHRHIAQRMYFNSMFSHSTICFRSEILNKVGFYPEDYKTAEDFGFLFEVVKNYKVANIPEVLVSYTVNPHGVSSVGTKIQVRERIRTIWKHFYFGYYPILGLVRNGLLLLFSRKFLIWVKKILYPKKTA